MTESFKYYGLVSMETLFHSERSTTHVGELILLEGLGPGAGFAGHVDGVMSGRVEKQIVYEECECLPKMLW